MLMTSLRTAVHAHWRDPTLARRWRCASTARSSRTCPAIATRLASSAASIRGSGRLIYVSAGHPPALLVRANGTRDSLHEGGPGMGLFEAAEFEEGSSSWAPGDTLVAYSDGVSEAWPRPGRSRRPHDGAGSRATPPCRSRCSPARSWPPSTAATAACGATTAPSSSCAGPRPAARKTAITGKSDRSVSFDRRRYGETHWPSVQVTRCRPTGSRNEDPDAAPKTGSKKLASSSGSWDR